MYELLGQIYKEILEIFDTDVVHMGGDEVRDSLSLGYLDESKVSKAKLYFILEQYIRYFA